MAFWHLQDHRYKQERILLLASLTALILGSTAVVWLYLHAGRAGTVAPPSTYPTKDVSTEEPGETPEQSAARRVQLEELYQQLLLITEGSDPAQTESVARSILALKSDDPEAWSRMGRVHEKRGETAQAVAAYDKAAAVPSKRQAFYLYQKASLIRVGGDQAGAIKIMQEAVRLHPESVEVSNLLMVFQIGAGEKDAVRLELKKYATLELDSQRVMWLLGAAALAMEEGAAAEAQRLLDDYEKRVPAEAFNKALGDAYFDAYRSRPEYRAYFLSDPKAPLQDAVTP